MPFTADPQNNVLDRLRLITGDTDTTDEGYPDAVYQYVLTKNSNNEMLSAIEILRMLVAKYASYVTEKAGGLFIKESDRYKHFKDLLDILTKDPRTAAIKAGSGFTGGISLSELDKTINDSDNRTNPFRVDRRTKPARSSDDIFRLR